MRDTTLLSKLGFSASDRVVVLHADDIGLCQSTVAAYEDITACGILSSASAMMPSGWLPSLLKTCRSSGHKHDLGVHLTLNSEWDGYRLSPLTGPAAKSLTDEHGYFHKSAAETMRCAKPGQVYAELRMQIEKAYAHDLDITHIDSHMLTLLTPGLAGIYLQLSGEFRIPNCIIRMSVPEIESLCNIPLERAEKVYEELSEHENRDLVVFDSWAALPLNWASNRLDCAKRLLDGLPEGLSTFICHPAKDSPELRAMANDWEARVADYELYVDDAWRAAVDTSGVKVIGMREIREALFGKETAGLGSQPATRRINA